MSVNKEELQGCIDHVFQHREQAQKRFEEENAFIQREAEKIGAKAEYKLVKDMTETEMMVRSRLTAQGEEFTTL